MKKQKIINTFMKKIMILLLAVCLFSCGKSMEEKAADAKRLQDIKDETSRIAETIKDMEAKRDFENKLGAINAEIRRLEKK
jgi:septal ring factor EnvC (AmiA/AmiB activator)